MAGVVGFMAALLEYRRLMLVAMEFRVFFARKTPVTMKPTMLSVIQTVNRHETSNAHQLSHLVHHETSNRIEMTAV